MSANVPPPLVALNNAEAAPLAPLSQPAASSSSAGGGSGGDGSGGDTSPPPPPPPLCALPLRRPVQRKRQRPRIVVPPFDFVPRTDMPSLPASFYAPQLSADDSHTRVGLWSDHDASGCASRRGSRRLHNEDRVFYDHHNRIYGVCDGHGAGAVRHAPREQLAADTVQQLLPRMLLQMPVADAFAELDRIVLAKLHEATVVGTTVAMVRLFDASRVLQVAHVGDSRAVLLGADGHARVLTTDHTPTRCDERARIERQGGYVHKRRVNDILSVSRAIGDKLLKYVVPPTPDVRHAPLRADDQLVLLATDGLWDVLSAADAAAMCRAMPQRARAVAVPADLQRAARRIVDEAMRRGSRDDITLVLLDVRAQRAAL